MISVKGVTRIFAAGMLAVWLSAPAQAAVVVGFDELAHDTDTWGIMNIGSLYASGGLVFSSSSDFLTYDRGRDYNADPLGTTLAVTGEVTVSRADGGLFDLASLQLAGGWNSNMDIGPIYFTFTDGAGVTTSSTFNLTRGLGLRTYAVNRSGISSFTIDGSAIHGGIVTGVVQIDNITYSPLASAVPEPSTWTMTIAGFGIAGAALRRRRRFTPEVC